jgi:hypothetical protein
MSCVPMKPNFQYMMKHKQYIKHNRWFFKKFKKSWIQRQNKLLPLIHARFNKMHMKNNCNNLRSRWYASMPSMTLAHNWWKSEGWKLETSIGLVWNPHSLLRWWCVFKKIKNCSDKTSRTMQNVNHAKLCKVQNDKPGQSLWGEVKCHKAQGCNCLRSYQLVGCLMPVLMVDTLCRPIRGQCCWSPWKYPDWFSAICCANTIMLGTLLISLVVMNMLQYFQKYYAQWPWPGSLHTIMT